MSYIASHIATVPCVQFEWYLVLPETPFRDDLKKEIGAHFTTLGRKAGKDIPFVRGFVPTAFRECAYGATFLYDTESRKRAKASSLLVTNQRASGGDVGCEDAGARQADDVSAGQNLQRAQVAGELAGPLLHALNRTPQSPHWTAGVIAA